MRLLKKFSRSVADTSKLERNYRLLTAALGWLIVAVGSALVVILMSQTRIALGLPLEEAALEGRRLQFLAWIGITLISIPVIFYGCMVLIAGAFGLIMALGGRFSLAEAKAYALFGEYPKHWFQQDT